MVIKFRINEAERKLLEKALRQANTARRKEMPLYTRRNTQYSIHTVAREFAVMGAHLFLKGYRK